MTEGIRVLYPKENTPTVEEPKKEKKVKRVNFALEKNKVHEFVKDPSEFLTL